MTINVPKLKDVVTNNLSGIYDFAPLTPVVSEFAILLCPVIPSICSEVFYVIAGRWMLLLSSQNTENIILISQI